MKVYLMHAHGWKEENFSKIGMSKNPTNRLKKLQHTKLPFLLTLAEEFEAGDRARFLEGHLQERYKRFRISGEWFQTLLDKRDFLLAGLEWLEMWWKWVEEQSSQYHGHPVLSGWAASEEGRSLQWLREETNEVCA